MKPKILITGSNGQLGSELNHISDTFSQFEFDFKNKKEFNLESEKSIADGLKDSSYAYIVNAGAYTAVDQAETDEERCFTINSRALKWLAQHAAAECKIIHISSDYVYNLNTTTALKESDQTNPSGIYAISKLLGEELLMATKPDSIVIRTSWVYSVYGNNFVKSMLRLGAEKESLDIVSDQIGSPTNARDLANSILKIIQSLQEKPQNDFSGIFNFSNSGLTNWADFAREIFKLTKINCEVRNTTTQDYGAPAHRPAWSVLDKQKIVSNFGIELISWQESLANCLLELDK